MVKKETELAKKLSLLEDDPLNHSLIKQIGFALYRLSEYETAKVFLERSFTLQPDNDVAERLGDCYFQLEQYELALEKYKDARNGRA